MSIKRKKIIFFFKYQVLLQGSPWKGEGTDGNPRNAKSPGITPTDKIMLDKTFPKIATMDMTNFFNFSAMLMSWGGMFNLIYFIFHVFILICF